MFGPCFIEWIRFVILPDDTFPQIDASTPRGRVASIAMRALSEARGRRFSRWGRIEETPNTMILVSGWLSTEHFEEFKGSEGGQKLIETISAVEAPEINLLDFGRYPGTVFTKVNRIWMRRIFFPAPVMEEKRSAVQKLRGLRAAGQMWAADRNRAPTLGETLPARSAWFPRTTRLSKAVQLQGCQSDRADSDLQCLVWCTFWDSKEAEQKALDRVESVLEERVSADGRKKSVLVGYRKLLQLWAKDLYENGAVGWIEEHTILDDTPVN